MKEYYIHVFYFNARVVNAINVTNGIQRLYLEVLLLQQIRKSFLEVARGESIWFDSTVGPGR